MLTPVENNTRLLERCNLLFSHMALAFGLLESKCPSFFAHRTRFLPALPHF